MKMPFSKFKKLVEETVFDQRELLELANESQWMSIEEYVKKNDLDLDEFLGCASSNGEPMSPDAKLPIDELDYYASNCEKSSKGYRQGKVFVFGIQWDTHDETTNPLPSRAKLTVPTPNGKADKQGIHDYLYSIYKVEPLDFDWEDLTNDLPHGMFAPRWGERADESSNEADIMDYINTMAGKIDYNQMVEDLVEEFGISKEEAQGYVDKSNFNDSDRFDESGKRELAVDSVEKDARGIPTKNGTKHRFVIKFSLDGDIETQTGKVWAFTEDEAIQKLLDQYDAIRTDVPLFEGKKNLSESTKVTLTLNQLRKLVNA